MSVECWERHSTVWSFYLNLVALFNYLDGLTDFDFLVLSFGSFALRGCEISSCFLRQFLCFWSLIEARQPSISFSPDQRETHSIFIATGVV